MRRSLLLALATTLLLVMACGGKGSDNPADSDSDGGGSISDKEASAAARGYILTLFDVLAGSEQPQALIDVYAPECRQGVKASDVAAVLGFIRIFAPSLSSLKIQDVDLGQINVVPQADGVEVTPQDPNALRLKVNGKFISANDYFEQLGFSQDDQVGNVDAILLVKRGGKVYAGDCDELSAFADPFGAATPTAGSTAVVPSASTAAPAGVGSSRSNAVPLGQPVQVESQWEITVLSVNRDAAAVVQAANSFNTPPAANERLVLIRVRAKSIATAQTAENIDDFNFRLTGSNNQLYSSFTDKTSCGVIPDEIDADLFPGGQTEGNLCFRVPADETGLLLVWQPFVSSGLTFMKLD